jgi:hypothetical protein
MKVAVICLGVIAILYWLGTTPSQSIDSQSSSLDYSSAITVSATGLQMDYKENTIAADEKYKNKAIQVSGEIKEVNTNAFDEGVIVLDAADEYSLPQFTLLSSEKSKAAGLLKGQFVTLLCTGAGDVVKTPMVNNCTIK